MSLEFPNVSQSLAGGAPLIGGVSDGWEGAVGDGLVDEEDGWVGRGSDGLLVEERGLVGGGREGLACEI